jgi:hypothetical protein
LEFFINVFAAVVMAKPFDGCVVLLFDLLYEGFDCRSCVRFLREEYDSGVAGVIINEGDVVISFTY